MSDTLQFDKSLLKACGDDTFIDARVEIRRPHLVTVGSHVAIDMGFYITVPGNIGDYIHIGPHVTIIGGKTGVFVMENFTTIAAGSRIVCSGDDHRGMGLVGPTIPGEYRDKITNAPVIFKRFASIGTNVVVHQGVTLGEGSVVGSCSLVTKDTQPWTIYAGVPAKPIKDRRSDLMMEYARKLGYL